MATRAEEEHVVDRVRWWIEGQDFRDEHGSRIPQVEWIIGKLVDMEPLNEPDAERHFVTLSARALGSVRGPTGG